MSTRRCRHLRAQSLPKHSTVTFTTVPPEENPTSYEWNDTIELCTFCAGFLRGVLSTERVCAE